jgi:hypothetical protein
MRARLKNRAFKTCYGGINTYCLHAGVGMLYCGHSPYAHPCPGGCVAPDVVFQDRYTL